VDGGFYLLWAAARITYTFLPVIRKAISAFVKPDDGYAVTEYASGLLSRSWESDVNRHWHRLSFPRPLGTFTMFAMFAETYE